MFFKVDNLALIIIAFVEYLFSMLLDDLSLASLLAKNIDNLSGDSIFVLFHFVFHYKLCIILCNIMCYIMQCYVLYYIIKIIANYNA